ncbi:MAG: hypothetical protein IPQ07_06885 [Myxococcales bacterium]|nr:hypothetical protein [Myxococcales bacterium]
MLLLAGCRTTVGPALSAGSVGVPGTATGIGGGAEIEVRHRSGLAAAVAVDLAGYASAGDADPIVWSEVSARYRLPLFDDGVTHVFVTPGLGAGYAFCCYIDDVVVSGFFEIAVERSVGRFRFGASLRERPAYFIGGGDPFAEMHNTLQLGVSVGVDR